jgi:dTDP-4-amino-4,6-dideoxygalactose transaminase
MKVPILKIPFDQNDAAEISQELTAMLLEGRLAMGSKVAQFERLFGDFVGCQYSVGASNGTTALEIIFLALRERLARLGRWPKSGGSVVVPANTFMASCLAPIAAGFKIILVDCDPDYFQMSVQDLSSKIRADTVAVLLVHLGGFISPHWAEIKALTEAHGAVLIEDAAHAHGAEADGHKAGTLGLAGAFSFYPTKVLTTAEGGMVVTDDEELYQAALALRQHGQERPGSNVHQRFGLNYRPSEIHALLGLAMMAKAEWILATRRRVAALYDELLKDSPVQAVIPPRGHKPSYYKYMALLPQGVDRDIIKLKLKDCSEVALAGEVYATPAHLQPLWTSHPEYLAEKLQPLANCELVASQQICLPIYPGLTREAQEHVVDSLGQALGL